MSSEYTASRTSLQPSLGAISSNMCDASLNTSDEYIGSHSSLQLSLVHIRHVGASPFRNRELCYLVSHTLVH